MYWNLIHVVAFAAAYLGFFLLWRYSHRKKDNRLSWWSLGALVGLTAEWTISFILRGLEQYFS